MDAQGAAGLLETSTGLAVLSALFLLAALHSWWCERRARRARRAKLLAALEAGPLESGAPARTQTHSAPDRAARGDAGPVLAEAAEPSGADAREVAPVPDEGSSSDAGTSAEAPDAPSSVDADQLGRLDDLIEQRAFQEARELVAELAVHAPQDPQLRRRAGRLALHCGRPEAALRLLEGCLERDPDDLESRLALCAAHAELQSFEDVVRQARRGLELRPREGRLLAHLSEAAFELGAPEEALELAADALRTRPKPESFFHLARLLAMTRRLAPTDSARLRHALERHPGEPALLHAAGVFEAMYGTRAAALRILRAASAREQAARHRRAIEREITALRDSEENAA